jgi:hypothetical protein
MITVLSPVLDEVAFRWKGRALAPPLQVLPDIIPVSRAPRSPDASGLRGARDE